MLLYHLSNVCVSADVHYYIISTMWPRQTEFASAFCCFNKLSDISRKGSFHILGRFFLDLVNIQQYLMTYVLAVLSVAGTMFGEDGGCVLVEDVEDIEDIVTHDDDITAHISTKELILPHVRARTKATGQRIEECMQADSIIPGRQCSHWMMQCLNNATLYIIYFTSGLHIMKTRAQDYKEKHKLNSKQFSGCVC